MQLELCKFVVLADILYCYRGNSTLQWVALTANSATYTVVGETTVGVQDSTIIVKRSCI